MERSWLGSTIALFTLTGALLGAGCSQDTTPMEEQIMNTIKDVDSQHWENLAQTRIYFGHQSVGKNILDGMRQIADRNPDLKLNFVHLGKSDNSAPAALGEVDGGWFTDSYIGDNAQPESKNSDFASIIAQLPSPDIAFAKYCYLDIRPQSNVQVIFRNYKETIERLKSEYPAVTFIHFTSPLTILQTGPKAWVKKLLGRDISGHTDNMKRHEYNQLLRQEYLGKEPLFDLAQLESTRQDGTRVTFEDSGQIYYSLAPEYTPDDGHLNVVGQMYIAAELLRFLAALASQLDLPGA